MKATDSLLAVFRRFLPLNRIFVISILGLTVLGLLLIRYSWITSMETIKNQALQLATVAETGFQKSSLNLLEVSPNDVNKLEFKQIKLSLEDLVRLNNDIRFAYIYTQKDAKIFFMADSEPSDSKDYSPPGQLYSEASEMTYQPFRDGKTLITPPQTDHWGTWISVLVPMKDIETGKVVAVLGVDIPTNYMYRYAISNSIEAGIIVLCLFFIIFAFYKIIRKNIQLKIEDNKLSEISVKLQQNEELFRTVFEQSPVGIAIVNNKERVYNINPMFEIIMGRTKEMLASLEWTSITHPDNLQEDMDNYQKFKSGETNGYSMVKRYIKPDGSYAWVNMTIAPLKLDSITELHHLCLIQDISEKINAEHALRESERSKSVLLNHLPGMAYRCKYDKDWTLLFVSERCFELTGYKAESLLYNKEKSFNKIISPLYREYLWNKWAEVISAKQSLIEEYEIITASGDIKWVLEQGQGVYDENGEVVALEGLIIDITDRKNREEKIQYLSDHDDLTGLYNRRYYERAKRRLDDENQLPLSVIIGDINGVKLINDAFGQDEGDKLIVETARILQSCCRDGDILARTGGDEFIILLPKTSKEVTFEIYQKIKETCEEFNRCISDEDTFFNISIGYNTKSMTYENLDRVIKVAEEQMYMHKLMEHKSSHSAIISSIKATMHEKSQETEAHEERLVALTKRFGFMLNLSQLEIYELELLSTLHDIGKVGIDDRILKKPDKLTESEMIEMKKHPEIGYRIAMSSPELRSIAEYILYHHERWDGKGYPQGIKEEEIPYFSRIIAVVDAFDAMTQDRVYRKAMTQAEAIVEIHANAGTQFDPHLARIFIEKVLN